MGSFMEKTGQRLADMSVVGRLVQGKSFSPDELVKSYADPFGHWGINKKKHSTPDVTVQGEAQYTPGAESPVAAGPVAAAPQQAGGAPAVARAAFTNQMELDNQRALQAFRNTKGSL